MTFQLVAGFGDASINGSVRIVQQPGGQTTFAQVISGELRLNPNIRGVPLDSRPGAVYIVNFDVLSVEGNSVAVNPIAVPACADGTTNDLGAMSADSHLNYVKKH
jgi:hypothetical protein